MNVIHAVGAVQVTIDLYAAAGEALAPIDAMTPDFAKARPSAIRNGMRIAISSEMSWSPHLMKWTQEFKCASPQDPDRAELSAESVLAAGIGVVSGPLENLVGARRVTSGSLR